MTPVTIDGSLAGAQAWLRTVQVRLQPDIDTAIVTVLEDTMQALIPITPVVSGRMQSDYTIAVGQAIWELIDTAESPKGYPYPGRVVFEAGFSRAYGALTQVLDAAERDMATRVDEALARLISG